MSHSWHSFTRGLHRYRLGLLLALPLAALAAAGLSVSPLGTGLARAATAAPVVRVSGNQLVNGSGAPMRLVGVDRSGTEYACVQGWGIFDGPSDSASVAAIASWHVDAVRVPLNEDCWLGINGVSSAYSGANYRQAIESYVSTLNAAGLVAVLDLHWSAPGTQRATGQQVMADADHSPAFWSSVATAFRSNPSVVFDLYNEPHDISWSCWLKGCTTAGGWQAAGMQSLLNAVRSTGASQPVLVGGLNWSGDLSSWLAYEPTDSAHQLVASAHIYNFSQCNTATCWTQTIAPVAAAVPVVTGEIGENDCAASFISSYMAWADAHAVSYLGWAWNTAGCSTFPALVSSYGGTPTAFGAGFQTHVAALAAASPLFGPGSGTSGGTTSGGSAVTPPPVSPQLNFADGATNGWRVQWGSNLSVSPDTYGLALVLNGTGYPGVAATSAPAGLAPGSTVTYQVDDPSGARLAVVPYAQDSAWTVHFAAPTTLAPGWNAVTWTVPSENGIEAIGLQVDDSSNFSGRLVLASASWPGSVTASAAPQLNFANFATRGWTVAWGSTARLSAGSYGLTLGLNGTGYPGFGSGSAPAGLKPGSTVTYLLDNPSGGRLSVLPYAQDSAWAVHFAPATTLAPGWNTMTWKVPSETGVAAIGLQVNDSSAFTGTLTLASAAW